MWEGDRENPPNVQQQWCRVSIRMPLQQPLGNPVHTLLGSSHEHALFIEVFVLFFFFFSSVLVTLISKLTRVKCNVVCFV